MSAIKKICIITSAHPVLDVRIFYKEAKSLKSAGYDVSLIAQHKKNEWIDGIAIIAIKPAKTRFERFFAVMPRMINAAFKQKADIYHFHDPDLILAGILLKVFSRSKIIYDVHEDVPKQILSKYWLPVIVRKPLAFLFGLIEKTFSKSFDAVITATPVLAEKFSNKQVICVANYPKTEHFKNFTVKEKSLPGEKFTAIYVGALEEIRGISEIVKACSLVDGKYKAALVMAGSFPDKLFEQRIKKIKEWEKVNFLGWLPYNEVREKLCLANVGLVCLYPIERFTVSYPVKMFEYMAAGIPVIASDFPLWKEIIEGNKCGVCVDSNNPKAISEAITSIAKNPGSAKKMGENGRRAVLNTYNWEKESKKMLDTYKLLIK